MTPEAQQIAIATVLGFKNIQKGGYCYIPEGQTYGNSKQLPRYLHDLNAMHEAEKIFDHASASVLNTWACNLNIVTRNNAIDKDIALARATAAQHAEAFLRALNRWVEDDNSDILRSRALEQEVLDILDKDETEPTEDEKGQIK